MVLVFVLIKPYKDTVVNAFSVINESVLLIIGFYLFIFLDSANQRPSNLRFYCKENPL